MNGLSDPLPEECSTIALYGIKPSVEAAECFYRTTIGWFNRKWYPPNAIGVSAPGHSKKMVLFGKGDSNLRKTGFDKVMSIDIESRIDAAESPFYWTAIYDGAHDPPNAVISARSFIAKLTSDSMMLIASQLVQILKPVYGIGYGRDHQLGPVWYAFGIGYGDKELRGETEEDALNRARWLDMGMSMRVYEQGTLRGVYPWNFLTAPQLTRSIGDVSLEQWIRQAPNRGTLNPLTDEVVLWEVPDADIPTVRAALKEAKAIFNWRDYVPQDQQGPSSPKEALRHVLKGQDLDQIQVIGGQTGKEIPPNEVRKIIDH